MTPTQAGLAYLRAQGGWTLTPARWWQSFARGGGVRKDLWEWQDYQGIHATPPDKLFFRIVGIQFCRLADAAAHEAKIRACQTWPLWQATGAGTLIVGVGLKAKEGKRGRRKVRVCVERWVV